MAEITADHEPFLPVGGKRGGLVAVDSFYGGILKGRRQGRSTYRSRHLHSLGEGVARARRREQERVGRVFEWIWSTWRKDWVPDRDNRGRQGGLSTRPPRLPRRSQRRTRLGSRSLHDHRNTTLWSNQSKGPSAKNAGPALHGHCFNSVRQLQREADAWLITYNHRRRYHGDCMISRRPIDLLGLASRHPKCRPPLSPQVLDR